MLAAAKRRPRHTHTGIELPRVDGRTLGARRFRALVETYAAELGGPLTEVDRGLIKQAAAIALRAEQVQAQIVAGETVDADEVIRLSSECRRILASLKAKAKHKPAGPTLAEYLAASRAAQAADEPEPTEDA